jgi:lipopolysaccharide assembly outer membrane protein LptD (OstA)
MKKIAVVIALLACWSVCSGQMKWQLQNPGPSRTLSLSADSTSRTADVGQDQNREKLLALRKELNNLSKTYSPQHPSVVAVQTEISRLEGVLRGYRRIIQLRGNVEIRTNAVTIAADEIDYDEDTGEMEIRGHVRAKFLK